jgi:hypothetical protein
MMVEGTLQNYEFYSVYFLSLASISIGFWLLDLSHLLNKFLKLSSHNRYQKDCPKKVPYEDEYVFYTGYQAAYASVGYFLCLLYGTVAPIVTIIGIIFFVFKFWVDKYCITFVYTSEYTGTGSLMDDIIDL